MTKRQRERIGRLLPGGIPKHIRVWDSGPEENDRYTVVFCGRYPKGTGYNRSYQYLGMNSQPFHPSYGICQHGESRDIIDCPYGWTEAIGRVCRHNPSLGRRIAFSDLPAPCQQIVLNDYCDIWGIPHTVGSGNSFTGYTVTVDDGTPGGFMLPAEKVAELA